MRVRFHIDKINQNHAADAAHSDLPRNFRRRFQVNQIRRFFVRNPRAPKSAGIDIDGRQRFRMLDDETSAGWQRDFTRKKERHIVLDAVRVKQISFFAPDGNGRPPFFSQKRSQKRRRLFVIRKNRVDVVRQIFPESANGQIAVAPNQPRRLLHPRALLHRFPKRDQTGELRLQCIRRRLCRSGSQNDAESLRHDFFDRLAKARPLRVFSNFSGHADVIRFRQQDDEP